MPTAALDPAVIAAILARFPDKVRLPAESMLEAGPNCGPKNIPGRYRAAAAADAARKEGRTDLRADIGRLATQKGNTVRAWGPIARIWKAEEDFLADISGLEFSHAVELTSLAQLPAEEGLTIARDLLQRARDANLSPREIGDAARAVVKKRKQAAKDGLNDVGLPQGTGISKRIDDLVAKVAQLQEQMHELSEKVSVLAGGSSRLGLSVSDDYPHDGKCKGPVNVESPHGPPTASGNGHDGNEAEGGKGDAA